MNWSSRIGEGGEGILNVLRLCAKGVLPEEDFLSLSKSNQVDILYAMSLAALLHPSRQRHFESYVESLAAEHFEGVHFSHFLLAHLVESFDETLVTASLKNRKAFFQSRFTELSRDEEAIQVIYELKSAQDIRGAYVCRDDAQVLNTHHALSQSSGHTSHSFELASLSQKKDVVAIQPIYIHVMGEFGVNIGGVEVSHAEFVRSKARMLCAILALEPGKYISCGKLACEIWPDYEYEKARTYLSILISHIRRVFRLTDGSCPYLVRERNAIALAGDYVKSDAGEIFRICNSADVARMDSDELSQTMHALVKLYSADLLEGVDDIALISNLRVMLKKTYVDKLLAISKAQESMRQYERALSASVWALHCDQTREDCYARAMHMYAQCSQRAQAVQVWQEYCTFMREEIGLSPSEDVHELYMHIIQDETHAGDDE